jgi:hypothetical protein
MLESHPPYSGSADRELGRGIGKLALKEEPATRWRLGPDIAQA